MFFTLAFGWVLFFFFLFQECKSLWQNALYYPKRQHVKGYAFFTCLKDFILLMLATLILQFDVIFHSKKKDPLLCSHSSFPGFSDLLWWLICLFILKTMIFTSFSFVFQETGKLVGTVVDVFSTGPNDLLQVMLNSTAKRHSQSGSLDSETGASGSFAWVPFVEAIVPHVDMNQRELLITPPKGLLELNLRSDVRSKKERRFLVCTAPSLYILMLLLWN